MAYSSPPLALSAPTLRRHITLVQTPQSRRRRPRPRDRQQRVRLPSPKSDVVNQASHLDCGVADSSRQWASGAGKGLSSGNGHAPHSAGAPRGGEEGDGAGGGRQIDCSPRHQRAAGHDKPGNVVCGARDHLRIIMGVCLHLPAVSHAGPPGIVLPGPTLAAARVRACALAVERVSLSGSPALSRFSGTRGASCGPWRWSAESCRRDSCATPGTVRPPPLSSWPWRIAAAVGRLGGVPLCPRAPRVRRRSPLSRRPALRAACWRTHTGRSGRGCGGGGSRSGGPRSAGTWCERGLARKADGRASLAPAAAALPWLYHGFTMALPWLYHGFTMSPAASAARPARPRRRHQ